MNLSGIKGNVNGWKKKVYNAVHQARNMIEEKKKNSEIYFLALLLFLNIALQNPHENKFTHIIPE